MGGQSGLEGMGSIVAESLANRVNAIDPYKILGCLLRGG